MTHALAHVLSYSSWFRNARLGVERFELLARGSAFFAHKRGEKASFREAFVSAHVAAPYRFRHYFSQDWLEYVQDADCRHVLEFRKRDGALQLAWPVHRLGLGGAVRDVDIPAELEHVEQDARCYQAHEAKMRNQADLLAQGFNRNGGASGNCILQDQERRRPIVEHTGDLQHNSGSVIFHPRGYDMAMLRIRDPLAMIQSLDLLPQSYVPMATTAGCGAPALGSQVQLCGWELVPGQNPEKLDKEGNAALHYTEHNAFMRAVHPSLQLSIPAEGSCTGRHVVESNGILEWGVCGAPVLLPPMRTADLGMDEPHLLGMLEGRCMLPRTQESAPSLGCLGVFLCVRHILTFFENQKQREASR
ncbi:hypothetical protein F1559_001391 [Cyanidiococcus yangmingshanensis]|uniref:Uncharacterized protein n=1 Tax=Cyanidiococcus yangmingshanensis TaxID=2690220 RepID=A0A7J7IEC9_9RHOD|nr:hypothetical protein F1559_001391 [Cyanidiococcus yangmingshanensis]